MRHVIVLSIVLLPVCASAQSVAEVRPTVETRVEAATEAPAGSAPGVSLSAPTPDAIHGAKVRLGSGAALTAIGVAGMAVGVGSLIYSGTMAFFGALGCDGSCTPDPSITTARNVAIGSFVAGGLMTAVGVPLLATGARDLRRARMDLQLRASFGSQSGLALSGRF
jgi:hypothetical protein